MKNKITLKELLGMHIIISVLVAVYYWCWARNDWQGDYEIIQNIVGISAFYFFLAQSIRMEKYKKEVNDEMAITSLRKSDSICLKITIALVVLISFISAILRFSISSEIIGYMLMGLVVCISVIRVVLFCIIDKKGS